MPTETELEKFNRQRKAYDDQLRESQADLTFQLRRGAADPPVQDPRVLEEAKNIASQQSQALLAGQDQSDFRHAAINKQLAPTPTTPAQEVLTRNKGPQGQANTPQAIQQSFGSGGANIGNKSQQQPQSSRVNDAFSSAARGAGTFFSGVGNAVGGFLGRFGEGFAAGTNGVSVYQAQAIRLGNEIRRQAIQEKQRVQQAESRWPQTFQKFKTLKASGAFSEYLTKRKFEDKKAGREDAPPYLTESDVEAVLRMNGFNLQDIDAVFLSKGGLSAIAALGMIPNEVLHKTRETYATQTAQNRANLENKQKQLLEIGSLLKRVQHTPGVGNPYAPGTQPVTYEPTDQLKALTPPGQTTGQVAAQLTGGQVTSGGNFISPSTLPEIKNKNYLQFLQDKLAKSTDKGSDTVSKKDLGALLAAVGASPEQIENLPDSVSSSMAEKLITQVGQTDRAEFTRGEISKNQKDMRQHRKDEREAKQVFERDMAEHKIDISESSKVRIMTLAAEQELILNQADEGSKVAIENLKAKNRLQTSLAEIEMRAKNTGEDQAIGIAAQNYRDVVRGTQQLESSFFDHILGLAESGSSTSSGRKSLFEKLVEDSVKAQPGLAPKIVEALVNNETLSPEEKQSARKVVAKTINAFSEQQKAGGRIQEILKGGNKALGEDYDNRFKQIQAFEAEFIDPKSLADKDMIKTEMARLQDMAVQRTQEIPAAAQKDIAQYSIMLGHIRRMRSTFTPEVIGPLNAWFAKGQIMTANSLRSFGLDSVADWIDKDPAAKLFVAESEMFRKTVSSLTGGLNLTEFEIEMVKQTQPVISNPNFLNALDIFELNVKDLMDARTAKLERGDTKQMKRLTDRAVARSQAFLRKRGIAPGDKTSQKKTWSSVKEAEAEFNRLITEEKLTSEEAYKRMQ